MKLSGIDPHLLRAELDRLIRAGKNPDVAEVVERLACAKPSAPPRPAPRRAASDERVLERMLEHLPAFALALALHLLILACLALIVFHREIPRLPSYAFAIFVDPGPLEPIPVGEQLEEVVPERADDTETTEAVPEPEPVETPPEPEPEPVAAEIPQPVPPVEEAPAAAAPTEAAAALTARRTGAERDAAIGRYGGTPEAQAAAEAGLAWLMTHQDRDGAWSPDHFDDHCKRPECRHDRADHDRCGDEACTDPTCMGSARCRKQRSVTKCTHPECQPCRELSCWGNGHPDLKLGLTGLALLAFLGGGHTHRDDTEAGRTVARALRFLLSQQRSSGILGSPDQPGEAGSTYQHAIFTLDLAEAYALTGDEALRQPLERAVAYLVDAQQAGGGWDYTGFATGRNDASISGWAVMALKSASLAGIDVPKDALRLARNFFDKATRSGGMVVYADADPGTGRQGIALVAVGLLSRLYLGERQGKPILATMADLVAANPPSLDRAQIDQFHNDYYWYYGTLAMFHLGGQRWLEWNLAMRTLLVGRQVRSGHAMGSWDPEALWLGSYCGRIYSTTMATLTLEVYYRYLPLYEQAMVSEEIDAPEDEAGDGAAAPGDAIATARALASSTSRQDRARGVRLAITSSDQPGAREALELYLGDESSTIRWQAIHALTDLADPAAVPALVRALPGEDPKLRTLIIDALVACQSPEHEDAILDALQRELAGRDKDLHAPVMKALAKLTGQAHADRKGWLEWLKSR